MTHLLLIPMMMKMRWTIYVNPVPHGGGGRILPTKFLGRHNSCSESSSSTKFGELS